MVNNIIVNAKYFVGNAAAILKANKAKAALLIAPKLITIPLLAFGSDLSLNDRVDEIFTDISTTINDKIENLKNDMEVEAADMIFDFEEAVNVSIGDINKLGIIINDGDCSDNYIESVCQCLDDAGIVYTFSRNGDNVNHDNSVVITLDQQYSAGNNAVFIAPFNNDGFENSDALAVSMKNSFDNSGIYNNGIYCGKRGYSESDGIVNTRVPTETEKAIDSNINTSFVNICLGTDTPDAKDVSKCIINGLAKFYAYTNNKSNMFPLIYRTEQGDSYSSVAEKLGVSPYDLPEYNGNDSDITLDTSIVNPNIPTVLKTSNVNVVGLEIAHEKLA